VGTRREYVKHEGGGDVDWPDVGQVELRTRLNCERHTAVELEDWVCSSEVGAQWGTPNCSGR